jgi:enoyl-[acyl-carrier protein] reductase II
VLRSSFSERAEHQNGPVVPDLENVLDLYFNGNLDASFAFGGQVAGRMDEVKPVEQILTETMTEFDAVMREIATRYVPA